MRANFDRALNFVLIDEGGNDDDPADRGGRTSRGITQREYDGWCDSHNAPRGDVWRASDPTIKAIYFVQYWSPWCDRLPNAIDYLYFDSAVLSGSHQATLFLQRALQDDQIVIDGRLGVATVAAANRVKPEDMEAFIDRFCEEHLQFYDKIVEERPSQQRFYNGWRSRVEHTRTNSKAMMEAPLVA